jgi:SAM-dependent methyltransferase
LDGKGPRRYRTVRTALDAGLNADPLLAKNREFYDQLWSDARLIPPDQFNTWALVEAVAARPGLRLEIGPGLRPRLPIVGTVFVDISVPALRSLQGAGGRPVAGLIGALPFVDGAFAVVCAMDIIEHVADDQAAFAELARVGAAGAVLLLAVPLHQAAWTAFDAIVGHHRRYEPAALVAQLAAVGFTIEQSAPSGMMPRSSWVRDVGMWLLKHDRRRAMWWYNRMLPRNLRRAPALALSAGMVDTAGAEGVLLVCRKV